MANEARITISLQIRVGQLSFQSQPTTYLADVSAAKGPTPGFLTVSTTGLDVDLSELTQPGLVWMQSLEPDGGNRVKWGLHDGSTFDSIGELLPGEIAQFRFSSDFGEEESVPGTGTTAPVKTFYMRAVSGSVNVIVHAFET